MAPLRSTHIHQRLCPQRKSGKYFVFITLLCLDIRKEGRIPLFGSGLTFSRPHDGLRGSGGWARFTPKPPGKCRLACRALWCRKKGLAVVSQTAARYRMESLRRLRKQVPQKAQSQWRSSNIDRALCSSISQLSSQCTIVLPEECLGYGLVVPFLACGSRFGFA